MYYLHFSEIISLRTMKYQYEIVYLSRIEGWLADTVIERQWVNTHATSV